METTQRRFSPRSGQLSSRMKAAPKSAPTLIRGLTHQIDLTDWRAAMDSTHQQSGGFRSPDRWNSVPVPERVARRAYERVNVDANGCWISTYSVGSHGYAQIGWQTEARVHMVLAHRAAWVHINGQLPLGMTLDHLCKARRCVNPAHLRMLPNYENARRTHGRDWPLGQCANGHDATRLKRSTRAANAQGFALICGACEAESHARWVAAHPERRKLANARYKWRLRHPGEPMPDHLALPGKAEDR